MLRAFWIVKGSWLMGRWAMSFLHEPGPSAFMRGQFVDGARTASLLAVTMSFEI
jgi:hypothetical protein